MKKWTHNGTGHDYHEVANGVFAAERCRVNDYDFVVGVLRSNGEFKVYPQATFNKVEHAGGIFYYGQMQTDDPVEPGDELRCYRAVFDGKTWFRPLREWTDDRFTCMADLP